MNREKTYIGIDKDEYGGMSPTGNIIRDAWVFGILPEEETCEGWSIGRIEGLYDKVTAAWAPHGHLVSNLPPELKARHQRIYDEAIKRARAQGWSPDADLEGD